MPLPQLEPLPAQLKIFSPIHIGTGEELDPFTYVIRDGFVLIIDTANWIYQFPDKSRLESILAAGDFAATRSFIAEHFDDRTSVINAVQVNSKKLLSIYQRAIKDRDAGKQVLIEPMIRNPLDAKPYIPGSAIKGAIRTAIANGVAMAAGVTSADAGPRGPDYNEKIFGRIQNDQMKWLKIGDVVLTDPSTVIMEAKEFSKNPSKPLTPKNFVEATIGSCNSDGSHEYPLSLRLAPFVLHGQKINPTSLIDVLNAFYLTKFDEEYRKFFTQPHATDVRRQMTHLTASVVGLGPNEALIRIGRFSHVECVTLDGVRKPRTRRGRDGRPLPYGTTRTLADGVLPFGWAKIAIDGIKGDTQSRPKVSQPKGQVPAEGVARISIGDISAALKKTLESLSQTQQKVTEAGESMPPTESTQEGRAAPPLTTPEPELTQLEKLMKALELIRSTDMGRLGTIIQKIDELETPDDKAAIARAIKDKLSPKAFKKHKRRDYLMSLIDGGRLF